MTNDILLELEQDAKNFSKVQEDTLLTILKENQDTEYGRRCRFAQIASVEAFQKNVPVTDYSDYEEYVERMLSGREQNLITAYPVRYYMVSSGTTGRQKQIPMTEPGIDHYGRYSYACAYEMMMEHYKKHGMPLKKDELCGKIFLLNEIRCRWMADGIQTLLVSSAVFQREQERGRFDSNRYTSPREVLFPECPMDMNYLKLRFALACEDVTAVEAVYVHQFVNLLHYMKKNWKLLVDDIASGTIHPAVDVPQSVRLRLQPRLHPDPGRAAYLRKEFQKGFDTPIVPRIWPKLRFVMAIGGEVFSAYMKRLQKDIGEIPYHYFIYAASEGVFGTAFGVGQPDVYLLTPRTGFFEFLPAGQEDLERCCKAADVEKGKKYELLYTGTAGFYRYRMGDVIEIVDFYHKAPVVKFCYRSMQCVNVAGEKMDMGNIAKAVGAFADTYGIEISEYCIYPDVDEIPARYIILLEMPKGQRLPDTPEKTAKVMDSLLRRQHLDYDDCRSLGEIGLPRVCFLRQGTFLRYQRRIQEQGTETGQYKPVRILDTWEKKEFFFSEMIDMQAGMAYL